MKTKIKRHYRSVVSVLLSVCMLVSCMTVGLIATDAAQVTGDESVGWNGDPTYVNLHLWKEVSGTTYTGDTVMTTKNQHYTVSFGNLPDRSSIKFGLNAKDGTTDQWLLPETNVNNQSVGDEKKYIWMKQTSTHEYVMNFDSECDYEVWWDSTDNNGNGIQISFKKAPQNNPTKITAPSGCTASVTEGTNTITSTGSASSGSLTQNSTATVTITPPTGKKVTTATLTGGTSQTLNLTSNHDGTYSATYTVPSNTTETAITFSEPVDKSSYKVNVVSSDVSEGTVAATVGGSPLDPDTSYPEDTAITLTATEENGFSFVEWDYKTTTDSSANPATYYVNGEDATGTTINITGEFGEHGYYIKIGTTGSYTAMTLLGNGKYISTAKVGSGNAPANKFMIKRSSDNKYANPGDDDYKFKADWISGSPVGWVGNEPNNKYFYQDNVSSGAALYVLYDPATDKISFSDDPQGHTPTTVLVKRGAVFSDGDGANISSTGTSVKNGTNVVSATVAGANKTSGFTDEWKEKSNPTVSYVRQVKFTAAEVGKGAKITVATTVTDSTLKVVGFVVNGESVLGSDITVSDDTLTYTMTYTIPEYPDTKIEITPVYAKKSGTIRFYVEGVDGEIRTKWGDTVYCYAYYGSAGTTATYGLGTWPGQPLLYDNGRYFIDLAEYDGDKKIVGIALNNGTWDTVHAYRILGSQTDSAKNNNQCQSYDYDDFVKINELENEKKTANPSYVKADIIFEMKSKGVVEPANSNFGTTYDTSGNNYPATIDVNSFTGWEYLTDYYGNRVDVFGNIIDPTDTHYNDEPYRLVSQGYDQNNVGYFATAWVVYQKSGSNYNKLTSVGSHGYVGMDSESKFLDSGLENQAGWSALKGKPAKITYEYGVYQEKGNGGQSDDGGPKPATRYDGRWYVSKVVPVKAHTLIEYGRTEHGTFRRDYYQENNIDYTSATGYDSTKTEGLVTKTRAHFSESPNLTESKKTTAKNEDGSSVNKFNFVAEDDVEGKYTFIGWYKYNAKGEAERVSTKKNYSVDVKNEEVLIARFIKTPAGTVTITHELLTGSEGLGTTLNSVSVVESNKSTPVAAFDPNPVTTNSTGAAKLPSIALTVENTFDTNNANADRGRLVKIVLNTTPNGATFKHFHYDINKSGSPAQLTASAPGNPFEITVDEANATATIYIPLSYFFKDENDDKIFDEDKDTLKFYSELIVSSKSFTVTKKLADYTESDAFTIKVETSTDGNSWSDYANQAYTSTGTGGNTNDTGLASIHQNETLTFANIAVGTYVRITETGTVKDYIFDSASAVKHNDTASPKNDISTVVGNVCSFQITDDDVDVTINNKRQEYKWIIKFEYNSRLWSKQGYQADGTFTKDQLDTYTTYTEVTDHTTGYTVPGIKFNSTEAKAAFVTQYLPHEDNFRQKVTWIAAEASENYYDDFKQISMSLTAHYTDAQQLTVQYQFPCKMTHNNTGSVATETDANGHARVYDSSVSTFTTDNVQYMNWYCLNDVKLSNGVPTGEPIFVSAPESIIDETDGNKVKYFHHWSVKTADGNVEYTKCYNREYNYAFYQNSIVTPVYVEADQPFDHTAVSEEARSENPATITFLEASRNQWNNKQCGTAKKVWDANGLYSDYGDRIFVDFVLDLHYIENGKNLQLNTIPEAQRSKYHAGLLIQQLGELDTYSEGDHKGEYITDSTYYASKYANNDGKTAAMTALTGGTATKANSYYNSVISVADFDNKNELEYYYNFANISQSADYRTRTAYKNYAFRAYTYLYVDGEQQIISAPVYFTMYDIASIENLYDIAQTKS